MAIDKPPNDQAMSHTSLHASTEVSIQAQPTPNHTREHSLSSVDEPVDLSDYRWEDWITVVVFWVLGLVVFYQFFTRYALDNSAAWTEEIARYLLIIVTFVGGAMATRRNTHIHLEFLYRFLSPTLGRILSTLVDLVRVGFLVYATYLSALLVPRMQFMNMTVVDFPMSYVYGMVTFGFAMMSYRAMVLAVVHWRQGFSTLERPEQAY
jgi:TRAP-type C4-dicarboxylate transport system permease small subunit